MAIELTTATQAVLSGIRGALGAANAPSVTVKDTDQVINGDTLIPVNDLIVSLDAQSTYQIQIGLIGQDSDNFVNIQCTSPDLVNLGGTWHTLQIDGSNNVVTSLSAPVTAEVPVLNTVLGQVVQNIVLTVGSTSGSFSVLAAQSVDTGAGAIIKAGSWIRAEKLTY
jgi:hypothetical protein